MDIFPPPARAHINTPTKRRIDTNNAAHTKIHPDTHNQTVIHTCAHTHAQ